MKWHTNEGKLREKGYAGMEGDCCRGVSWPHTGQHELQMLFWMVNLTEEAEKDLHQGKEAGPVSPTAWKQPPQRKVTKGQGPKK